jgi:transcriptional regulator with XRE-family HTH domain
MRPRDRRPQERLRVMDETTPVGHRIARLRRKRGITQEALAGLVGRSESWLVKIESGKRTVESIKDLLLLANALKVEPGEIIGKLSLPPNGGAPLDPPRGIPAIRRALFAVLDTDERPDTAQLRADIVQANALTGNGRYGAVALGLPRLITLARTVVVQDVPSAWWNLAAAYHVERTSPAMWRTGTWGCLPQIGRSAQRNAPATKCSWH